MIRRLLAPAQLASKLTVVALAASASLAWAPSAFAGEGSAVGKLKAALEAGKPARTVDLTEDEQISARDLHLITAKPMLYVANVDEASLTEGNEHTRKVQARAAEEGSEVVRICGALESEIALAA